MRGFDVWYRKGTVDFKKVKASGIDFILPRDGWGPNNIDYKLVEYVKQALDAGVEVPGVFHMIYGINIQEAILNAEKAISNVKAAGLPQSTIIWCDLEYDTVDNARDHRGVNLTPSMQRNMVEAFCNYILANGYPTGIYCNADYIENVYGRDILNDYDIWLADLYGDPDYPCVYRQYDWHGMVPGCNEEVDLDEYVGQYTAGTARVKGGSMYKKYYTEEQLVDALKTLARGKSSYYNKAPWNLLYWDGTRFWADCNNLYKALFNGRDINNKTPGSWQSDLSNTGDLTGSQLMDTCDDVSKDFSTLGDRFECLYLESGDEWHFGGYLGEEWDEPGQGTVNCVEATPAWEDGIQFSYVAPDGGRYWAKGKNPRGYWTKHGIPTKFIDYSKKPKPEPEPEPTPTPTPKEGKISVDKFITYLPLIKRGNNGEMVSILQQALKELGYYNDEIDGSAGPNTARAIESFQKDVGLYPDGLFGPKSWRKLLIG